AGLLFSLGAIPLTSSNPDPALLAALAAAVERDPASIPIRLHLAQLLLASGAEGSALEHFSTIIEGDPANLEALRGAAAAAGAVAGEMGARFIPIGLADVLSMWLGQSERHLHELFQTARRNAPCILFFDELDAIGLKRSQLSHSAGRNVATSCSPSSMASGPV